MTEPRAELQVRLADADREQVAGIVRGAVGAGYFDLDEADRRLQAVYGATVRGDLVGITADLPNEGRDLLPRPRERRRIRIAPPLAVYLAVSLLLVTIWAATGAGDFWPVWYLGFGLFGVFKHGGHRGRGAAPWSRGYAGSKRVSAGGAQRL